VSIGNNKNSFAVFGLLFGATIWGIIWYPYRLLADVGISGFSSTFYTYAIATLLTSLIYVRHWRALFSPPKGVFALAFAAGFTNLCYVLAMIDGEVMRVMLLFYLCPIWTLLLAHYWLKERADLKDIAMILVSLLGAFIMLYDASSPYNLPLPQSKSDWLGLLAGMGFALTNVITRKSAHLTIYAKTFAIWYGVSAVSFIGILLIGDSFKIPATANAADGWMILIVGLILIANTYFVQYGVTHVPATRASIIFLFELVVAAIAAYFLAGEVMTINGWIGGVFIVSAAIYSAIKQEATP
jgi:drug/metabolite transporter (DMT)-like permease